MILGGGVFAVGLFVGFLFGGFFFIRFLFVGFLGDILFADILPVADAEHHDHIIGLLGTEDVAGDAPPVEIAFDVVAEQAGINLVLANDADLGRVGERILKTIGQPVGHAVAEHHHRRRRRDLLGFRVQLARGRRTRIIGRCLLLKIAVVLPPVGRAEQLLEKALAARRALAAQERIVLRHRRADHAGDGQSGVVGGAQNGEDRQTLQKPVFPRHADAQI